MRENLKIDKSRQESTKTDKYGQKDTETDEHENRHNNRQNVNGKPKFNREMLGEENQKGKSKRSTTENILKST